MKKLFMLVSALVLCLSACSSNPTPPDSNKEVAKVSETTKTEDTTKNKEEVENKKDEIAESKKTTTDDKKKDDKSTDKTSSDKSDSNKKPSNTSDKSNTSTSKKPSSNENTANNNKKPSNTSNNSSSKKPSDNSSNNNNSNNNSSNNKKPSKPEPEPKPKPQPHKHWYLDDGSFSKYGEVYYDYSRWFNSYDEADVYVDALAEQKGWSSLNYSELECSCGKIGVIVFNISYFDPDFIIDCTGEGACE